MKGMQAPLENPSKDLASMLHLDQRMNHNEHELDMLSISASLERKSVKVGLLSESLRQ
jgi:hypothetical protein